MWDSTLNQENVFSDEERIKIIEALEIMHRVCKKGEVLGSPEMVNTYLRLKIGPETKEHFGVIFLDTKGAVIADEIMSTGTIDCASVFPREILKAAILKNAASLILYHNHPSGNLEPSLADKNITQSIIGACKYCDIKVLDHVIVSYSGFYSFANHGLI